MCGDFGRCLHVARVAGHQYGDIAAAPTLPSPLFRTRPYTALPTKPSLRLCDRG